MASVTFPTTEDRIPAPYREEVEAAIADVLRERTPAEEWTVRAHETADGVLRVFEFALSGTERAESLQHNPEDDDEMYNTLRSAVRCFLKDNWPTPLTS